MKRWDFGRFLKTAGFFNAIIPSLPFYSKLSKNKVNLAPNMAIWSANGVGKTMVDVEWGPLDDVVMGGVSKSDLSIGKIFAGEWSGYVSTENNGGFAGIRTKLFSRPLDCSSCSGLKIKIRGDGQRFKFIIRDDEEWNGTAWSFSLDTKVNGTVEVKVPFDKFKPTKFAKTLKDFRSFDKSRLTGLQLTLSKFEYDGELNPKFREGPFSVELKSIGTY